MRVLHIAPLNDALEQHFLTALPAMRLLGIRAELLVLFAKNPPMPAFINHMRKHKVAVLGYKLPHLDDIYHASTLPMLMQLATFIKTRQPMLVHTHMATGDFFGGYGGRWAGVTKRISTHHHADDDRTAPHWREVATLFMAHIAPTSDIAQQIQAQNDVPASRIQLIALDDVARVVALYQTFT